jgi:hypothetical protein
MQDTWFTGRVDVSRLTHALCLSLAALLGGCAVESGDAPDAASEPPEAVRIITPPRLAPRARVPEKEPGFVSAEVTAHELFLAHDGRLAAPVAGEILGGTQGGGYLVRVEGARAIDAAHLVVETAPAELGDLIVEGEFHVHYDAEEHARREAAQRDVGEQDGERIGSGASALTLSPRPVRLVDLSHVALPASCVGEGGAADLDVVAAFSPVLDIDVKVASARLEVLRVVASGRLDVDARLRASGTISGDCSEALAQRAGLPTISLPSATFWVGPVPVSIHFDLDPRVDADVSLSLASAEVEAEAHTRTALDVGVDYEQRAWRTIWRPSCTAAGAADVAAKGPTAATAKVSVGAELRARLYGIVGPSLGVVAHARVGADAAPPACTFDARTDCGVEAYARVEAGLSLGPLDLTLAGLDLVRLDLLHGDGPPISGQLRDAPGCDADR